MSFFRKNRFFRFFCFLLALHIFNISVDMPDSSPDYVPEDLTVNDQESVVELVLEKCIGIDNAVEEHDEPDDDAQDFEMTKEFKIYSNTYLTVSFVRYYLEMNVSIPHQKSAYAYQYVREINPPPPKA